MSSGYQIMPPYSEITAKPGTTLCGSGGCNKDKCCDIKCVGIGTLPKSNKWDGCALEDVDCVPGTTYSAWTKCSKECGGGLQYRNRLGDTKPKGEGKECTNLTGAAGENIVWRRCNTHTCPVDCKLATGNNKWGAYGACSAGCGTADSTSGGRETKTQRIEVQREGSGKACPNRQTITRNCFSTANCATASNTDYCPGWDCQDRKEGQYCWVDGRKAYECVKKFYLASGYKKRWKTL